MAKDGYVGVNNSARKVKGVYVGVNNIARKVTNGYVGVGNTARPWFSSSVPFWYMKTLSLPFSPSQSVSCRGPAANTQTGAVICPVYADSGIVCSLDYGLNWSYQASVMPSSGNWTGSVFGTSRWYSMTAEGAVATSASTNGRSGWSALPSLPAASGANAWVKIIATSYGGTNYILCIRRTGQVYRLVEGTTAWTQVLAAWNTNVTNTACTADGRIFLLDSYGTARYSANGGTSWTSVTLPTAQGIWTTPVFTGSMWLVIDYKGKVFGTSANGTTWSMSSMAAPSETGSVVVAGGYLVYINSTSRVSVCSASNPAAGFTTEWAEPNLGSTNVAQLIYTGKYLIALGITTQAKLLGYSKPL